MTAWKCCSEIKMAVSLFPNISPPRLAVASKLMEPLTTFWYLCHVKDCIALAFTAFRPLNPKLDGSLHLVHVIHRNIQQQQHR